MNGKKIAWGAVAVAAALVVAGPAQAGTLLPERGGSPNADRIASLYGLVLVLAAIVFVGVTVALVYALVRYRARRSPLAAQIRGNTRLELGWTAGATLLIVFIAVFSLTKLSAIEHPDRAEASAAAVAAGVVRAPGDRLRIEVIGRQYVWAYRYPNGVLAYGDLVAPVGVTVELSVVALDVAHSWWIPKLGGKFDAIPGLVNHTWFRLERTGVFPGQCAELCGRNHADMTARVRGVTPAAYVAWLDRQKRLIAAAHRAADAQRPTITRHAPARP